LLIWGIFAWTSPAETSNSLTGEGLVTWAVDELASDGVPCRVTSAPEFNGGLMMFIAETLQWRCHVADGRLAAPARCALVQISCTRLEQDKDRLGKRLTGGVALCDPRNELRIRNCACSRAKATWPCLHLLHAEDFCPTPSCRPIVRQSEAGLV
jgi:hypothetical protein